jgi:hypothetical protein
MKTYIIHRHSGWSSHDELGKAASRSARVGETEMPDRVRWIRSYVTEQPDQRLGTVCIYQATDPEALREHARRANLPCDSIVSVADTVVINPDPLKVTES